MSSAVSAAVAMTGRPVRFRRPPPIRKLLRRDDRGLPRPPVPILVRETHPCRLADHYHHTLQDDLMYMTYKHEAGARPPPKEIRLKWDPNDPYTKFRHNPPIGGEKMVKKPLPPSSPYNVVKLEKVSLHTFQTDALTNRSNLLGAIMAFRALSGETQGGGGRHNASGVQITRGKKTVGGWIRPGIPCGVKVDMKGDKMYDFLGTLTEFVLPRLREFSGVTMPPASKTLESPSAVSGVVSFGLPPIAMALFPQIEVNMDAYPKMYGMHIHIITSTEGVGAQNHARALASGLQIPFSRQ